MFVLVLGGAASGKSEYGEGLCMELSGGESMLYVATMEPFGEEAHARIERHHKLRESKGFETIEQYRNLGEMKCDDYDTILLECMSTLLANEMFADEVDGDESCDGYEETDMCEVRIFNGIDLLRSKSCNLVLISNLIFSDGITYDKATMKYIEVLGRLNQKLAQLADVVVEVVCGIPVYKKQHADWPLELRKEE